jgi:hypothetical protein
VNSFRSAAVSVVSGVRKSYRSLGMLVAAAVVYAAVSLPAQAQVVLPTGISTTVLEDTGEATMTRFLSYFVIGIGFLIAIGLTVGLTMWLVGVMGAKRKGIRG